MPQPFSISLKASIHPDFGIAMMTVVGRNKPLRTPGRRGVSGAGARFHRKHLPFAVPWTPLKAKLGRTLPPRQAYFGLQRGMPSQHEGGGR